MKITEMIAREDFYAINELTLNRYYKSSNDECILYIYPKLNAIVTKNPGKAVKDYIRTEYTLKSFVKQMAANAYINLCFNIHGRLAEKKQVIHNKVSDNTLIYPCNKKIRIFDFDKNVVSVILKEGFDSHDIQHEIEFRKKDDNPSFVPRLITVLQNGYIEQIIDGKPLVRITDQSELNLLKKQTYEEFRTVYKEYDKEVGSEEYLKLIVNSILEESNKKNVDGKTLKEVLDILCNQCRGINTIPIVFSHGDLQPGNIWIENNSRNLYIIDWESWGSRSVWYDQEVLFNGLRPGRVKNYLSTCSKTGEILFVVLEDILFQIRELNSLPSDFGEKKFNQYIFDVFEWLREDNLNA